MEKIIIPVAHYKNRQVYEIFIDDEHWEIFKKSLKAVAEIKGNKITFKVKEH